MQQCPLCGKPLPTDDAPCPCGVAQGSPAGQKTVEFAPEHDEPCRRHVFPLAAIPLILLVGVAVFLIILFSVSEPITSTNYPLFREDLIPVAQTVVAADGTSAVKWGYANKEGALVIGPTFEMAREFAENGLAPVKQNALWGYIDTSGNFVIAVQFEDAEPFAENGFACIKANNSWGYINKKGTLLINPQFDSAFPFADNGLALVSIGGKYGYINEAGVYVIEPRFDAARSFDENGYAAVLAFENWGMIDKRGEWVINPQFDAIGSFAENDLALVYKDEKYGFIDRDGVYVVKPVYEYAESFSEGLALIKQDGKYGYINQKGGIAIAPTYKNAHSFADNGLAAVCMAEHAELWGYVNKSGEIVIAAQYTEAGDFSNGFAAVKKDGKWSYIDKNGSAQLTFDESYLVATPFAADGYAITIQADAANGTVTYYIINKSGKLNDSGYLFVLPYSMARSPEIAR